MKSIIIYIIFTGLISVFAVEKTESRFGVFKFDLEPKPLALAYKTIIKMLGERSKPSYTEKDGVFIVNWINKETDKNFSAIWSVKGNKKFNFGKLTPNKFYDIFGKEILSSENTLQIGESPIYVEWK